MSGGTWNYMQFAIRDTLHDVADTVKGDMPNTAESLNLLADKLFDIMHKLDWHYAGDTNIDDLAGEDHRIINELRSHIYVVDPIKGSWDWAQRYAREHRANVAHPVQFPGTVFMWDDGDGKLVAIQGPEVRLDVLNPRFVIPAYGWEEVPWTSR